MKRILSLLGVVALALPVLAQKGVDFRQSQARIIEPLQDVYVRPLVVDLEIIKEDIQAYGPFTEYGETDVTALTYQLLEEAKKNAAYRAAITDNADVIVGATFDIRTPAGGKGIEVTVRGYPAKYTNWRKIEPSDYEWLQRGLFEGLALRQRTAKADATEAAK